MTDTVSAVILSSGTSERMGQPKALLKWDRSVTFIEKILNEFLVSGCSQVICMINEQTESFCRALKVPGEVKFVVNHHPEWGRFYSIRTGIDRISGSDYCFIHNVDNPFVDQEIIERILAKRNPASWCSPVFRDKGGHPVLLPGCICKEIAKVEDLNSTLMDVLALYPKVKVEASHDGILRNINTPEEYNGIFGIREI
jgi:molybdenum cofactor cytidylyltransferase